MPFKITKKCSISFSLCILPMVCTFIGILILVLSHSYFAQHIFSNGKIRSTKRAWSYFSYSHYVAMLGDNRIKNKKQQISVSNFSG